MTEFEEFDDELERELGRELRSREAPEGFAARVMERLPRAQLSPQVWRLPWAITSWAAAVLMAAVALGGYLGYQHEQRIAGEQARQQVLLALRITHATLQSVRDKMTEDHTGNEAEP